MVSTSFISSSKSPALNHWHPPFKHFKNFGAFDLSMSSSLCLDLTTSALLLMVLWPPQTDMISLLSGLELPSLQSLLLLLLELLDEMTGGEAAQS